MAHPRITVVREEVTALPRPGIIATGPLTSDALAEAIRARLGVESLAFYDAIAPIVVARLDRRRSSCSAHRATARRRWRRPATTARISTARFTREQYEAFIDALIAADQHHGHEFDEVPYFEGCMPAEEMAKRGRETLRFGPMKPVGLRDPRTGRERTRSCSCAWKIAPARCGTSSASRRGCAFREQQRVFRMIPGLENAEFLRYGSIHRNSYVNSPASLTPHLSLRDDPHDAVRRPAHRRRGLHGEHARPACSPGSISRACSHGDEPVIPPPTTMLGALYRYLREADPKHFQPMNANFGLRRRARASA